jgi:hypothetical protein
MRLDLDAFRKTRDLPSVRRHIPDVSNIECEHIEAGTVVVGTIKATEDC